MVISKLLQAFCNHHTMHKRRLDVDGLSVMHHVCPDCGYSVPVIGRSQEAYAAGLAKQVPLPKAKKAEPVPASERARVLEMLRPAK